MKGIMGVAMGIIGVALALIMFPLVMDSTHDVKVDTDIDVNAAVATGVGETDADVVLGQDLYLDDTDYIDSITSDNQNDTPVAGVYTAGTNSLNVTGLEADATRTLTVTYEYDALTEYTGMSAMVGMTPLLILVAIIAVVIGGAWFAVKGKG